MPVPPPPQVMTAFRGTSPEKMMSRELTVTPVLFSMAKNAEEPVVVRLGVVNEDKRNGFPELRHQWPPLPFTLGQLVAAVRLTMPAEAELGNTKAITTKPKSNPRPALRFRMELSSETTREIAGK